MDVVFSTYPAEFAWVHGSLYLCFSVVPTTRYQHIWFHYLLMTEGLFPLVYNPYYSFFPGTMLEIESAQTIRSSSTQP